MRCDAVLKIYDNKFWEEIFIFLVFGGYLDTIHGLELTSYQLHMVHMLSTINVFIHNYNQPIGDVQFINI